MYKSVNRVKNIISPLFHHLSYQTGLSTFIAHRRKGLRILMYHGVGGPDCSLKAFTGQMKYIAKNYNVIHLKDFIRGIKTREMDLDSCIALTFDDGLKNNYTKAYSVLRQLNLPATFFVCPGLIESGAWIWPYDIAQRLLSCTDEVIEAITCKVMVPVRTKVCSRQVIVEEIVDWMKTLYIKERLEVEHEIRYATQNYAPTLDEIEQYESMSWSDIKALSPDLITIGSHSVNHPILTRLPYDIMEDEILGSKVWLERELMTNIDLFCYPNGDVDQNVKAVVEKYYAGAVTVESGLVTQTDNPYMLNRIPAPNNVAYLAWKMFRF